MLAVVLNWAFAIAPRVALSAFIAILVLEHLQRERVVVHVPATTIGITHLDAGIRLGAVGVESRSSVVRIHRPLVRTPLFFPLTCCAIVSFGPYRPFLRLKYVVQAVARRRIPLHVYPTIAVLVFAAMALLFYLLSGDADVDALPLAW